MEHIFVTNQVYGYDGASNNTVINTDTINLLNAGGVAIFNQSTGAIVPASTVLGATTGQTYMFAVANGDDGTVKPDIISIQWDKVKSITSKVAAAATAKVMAFGDISMQLAFGTITAGSTYTLVIIDKDKSIHATDRRRMYSVISVTGDTSVTIVNKFVNKIANDSFQTVVASNFSSSVGIKFVGLAGRNYTVEVMDDLVGVGSVIEAAKADLSGAFIDGQYYDASTPVTLATKYGNAVLDGDEGADIGYAMYSDGFGTYAQVKEVVEELSSHKGDIKSTYRTDAFYSANTNLEAGATYKMYTIEYSGGPSSSPMQAESFTLKLMIAAKTGTAIIGVLDAMLITEAAAGITHPKAV